MERWVNKVAVVTGASSGIGVACVKDLLAAGMIVVGLARRLERMEIELKVNLPEDQQERFHPLKCDVTKEADIVAAFAWVEENLGGVHVLINNAGILKPTAITAENNTDDLRATLETNVLGVALCTREAFRLMQQKSVDGHIIIINSIMGHYLPVVPGLNWNMYAPSKYAVTAMTEVLRRDFQAAGSKTKITSISPGVVETEIFGDDALLSDEPSLKANDISNAILYCIGTPPLVQIHDLIIKANGEIY